MTAYKCDRCGKYFDKIKSFKDFKILGWSVVSLRYKTNNGGNFDIELCPECRDSFKNWFNEFAIDAPEETESEETNA
jgi:predicted nucleic acid-binding Zn ribbon protein